jgi:hypothetical protein
VHCTVSKEHTTLGSEGEFVVVVRYHIRLACTIEDLEEHVIWLLLEKTL